MIKRQFATAAGVRHWGYIHTPADRTKKYPVVFFFHGVGEAGKTEADATKLLAHGPQYHVNRGWNPDIIIIALQHHTWSFPPEHMAYTLANDPDVKALGNGKVMATGLSAGGANVVEVMKRFHSPNYVYVPMSPAIGVINTYPNYTYKVWGFVGNNDQTTKGALQGLYDMQAKIGAKVTVYQGGHGGWNTYYNPAYKEDGKNIYEWAFDSVVVPPVEPPVEPPIKTVVSHWEFILYSDGTASANELI